MISKVIFDYSMGKTQWEKMSSSDGESIFLTQSKFRDPEESVNTDGILSDILDMKKNPREWVK